MSDLETSRRTGRFFVVDIETTTKGGDQRGWIDFDGFCPHPQVIHQYENRLQNRLTSHLLPIARVSYVLSTSLERNSTVK
jgi:hypothetical protein